MIIKRTGIVHSVGEVQVFGNYKKREIVLKVAGERWDNYLPLEVGGDSADQVTVKVGDEIETEYWESGQLGKGNHEGRCFLNLKVKSLNVVNAAPDDSQRGELASDKDFGHRQANDASDNEDIPF